MSKHSLQIFLSSCLLFFCCTSTNAQLTTLAWQKCVGGSSYDEGRFIIKTNDNNYLLLGLSSSSDGDVLPIHGVSDLYVAKLTPTGTILWKKSLGGTQFDRGTFMQQTNDNGYIICGYSSSNDGDLDTNYGNYDTWVIKLNASGVIQWQKSYGGSQMDLALSITQTFDGGYAFAGWSRSIDGDLASNINKGDEDAWVVKLDDTGKVEWQKNYGGSAEDHFTAIIQTPDSNYVLAGSVKSFDGDVVGHHGAEDCWVVKIDGDNGSIIWQRPLGGTNLDHFGDHGLAGCIEYTYDGGFVFSGWSNSTNGNVTGNHGDYDAWIVKLNATGNVVWQKSVGSTKDDEVFYLVQMPDSSFIAAGLTNSPNLNISGDTLDYDMWVFKLDKDGNEIWEEAFGGPAPGKEVAFGIAQSVDTSVIITGYCTADGGHVSGFKGGQYDIWVAKLDIPKPPPPLSVESIKSSKIVVAPNPTRSLVNVFGVPANVQLYLYNALGQFVKYVKGSQIILEDQPNGIYFLQVYNNKNLLLKSQKLIKE